MSKVNYGIQDVYIAKITEDNGVISYGTPFAVKGAVGLNIDPEGGEATPFYADNIVYYMAPAVNNGYSGDLELAIAPAEFLTQILGQEQDENGVVYETADDENARFALMFQAQGDDNDRRFCFYDCTATRPSRENSTKEETITPGTDTLYASINKAMVKVEESGYEVTGLLGGVGLKGKFRMMTDATGQPLNTTEIGSLNRAFVDNGAWDKTKATLIAGDFNEAVYSIRQDVTFDVFREGVIQNPDGSIAYNLMQEDMSAIRVVFRIGTAIPNEVTSLDGTENRFPFAALVPAEGEASL